jgi:hypothetical protein
MHNDSNSNSFFLNALDDPAVQTLPWVFRAKVAGLQCGWPPV